ncbi:3'-5' exonuclease [Alkalicoccus urumqiensis]|uniref:Exonuclease domain-containing protein n=1 Tax=Alkalicoccus urumqiensis TaxID=1548213 RepID=A0A2P6MED6_ALKUR|nr:3'-5' exonuclease [Alkalicoccus urumqiensis]PRO64654.1 hypothetical protein C6I21_13180 [Alkalicoccus urumqiensis]
MNFTAIDFETASQEAGSACAVGIVQVKDSEIVEETYSLIRPFTPYFDPKCVAVHGLTWNDVKDAPTFADLWPSLQPAMEHTLLLAHNASFDMRVLRSALDAWQLPWPEAAYNCTVQIAKKTWPEFFNHKLGTVAHELGITFEHHHALEDARAAAVIALRAEEIHNAFSEEALFSALNLYSGSLGPGMHATPGTNRKRKRFIVSASGAV